jgi:hypothetical protein
MCDPNRIGGSPLSVPGRLAKILPAGSMLGLRPAVVISPMT